jgi:hypothetical protein
MEDDMETLLQEEDADQIIALIAADLASSGTKVKLAQLLEMVRAVVGLYRRERCRRVKLEILLAHCRCRYLL